MTTIITLIISMGLFLFAIYKKKYDIAIKITMVLTATILLELIISIIANTNSLYQDGIALFGNLSRLYVGDGIWTYNIFVDKAIDCIYILLLETALLILYKLTEKSK